MKVEYLGLTLMSFLSSVEWILTEIILWQILLNIDISRMINTVWKILRNKVLRNILGNKILGNEILGNRLTIFWKE